MQSVPITTDVVSSNPGHVQFYVIKFVSHSVTCGRSVVFSGTQVSSTNKTDRNDIIEILLKVASLNTINVNPNPVPCWGILHVSHIRSHY